MATYTILSAAAPYYTVRVEFGAYWFDQALVSEKTGAKLIAQLQGYADQYEADWRAVQTPDRPTPDSV